MHLLDRLRSLACRNGGWSPAACIRPSGTRSPIVRAAPGIKDYDLIYYDSDDLSWEAEDAVIQTCRRGNAGLRRSGGGAQPGARASVVPRALRCAYPQLAAADESLRYYASIVHAVGVRLEDDGRSISSRRSASTTCSPWSSGPIARWPMPHRTPARPRARRRSGRKLSSNHGQAVTPVLQVERTWSSTSLCARDFRAPSPPRCARSMASASRSMRGEAFGLVGESGCGKSTAARATLRLIEPDARQHPLRGHRRARREWRRAEHAAPAHADRVPGSVFVAEPAPQHRPHAGRTARRARHRPRPRRTRACGRAAGGGRHCRRARSTATRTNSPAASASASASRVRSRCSRS